MRVWLIICVLAGIGSTIDFGFAAAADRYSVTPEEHAACDDDAEKLCSDAFPDEDKLVSCMRSKRNDLTPICLASLKAGLARRHMPPL